MIELLRAIRPSRTRSRSPPRAAGRRSGAATANVQSASFSSRRNGARTQPCPPPCRAGRSSKPDAGRVRGSRADSIRGAPRRQKRRANAGAACEDERQEQRPPGPTARQRCMRAPAAVVSATSGSGDVEESLLVWRNARSRPDAACDARRSEHRARRAAVTQTARARIAARFPRCRRARRAAGAPMKTSDSFAYRIPCAVSAG